MEETATTEEQVVRTGFDAFMHRAFADTKSKLYGRISNFVVLVIFFSIATIVAETVGDNETRYATFFYWAEIFAVIVFGLEYIANLYVTRPMRKYTLSVWGIIDLAAILPSLVQAMNLSALKIARILRVLRFLRLLRILKLAKNVAEDFQESQSKKSGTLKMDLQIYFIALFAALVICSTLVYYAEMNVPDTLFTDIPSSMWWGIVTMTTVGYGDMAPETVPGRVVAGITGLIGLVLFALLMQVVGKAVLQGLFGSDDEVGDELGEEGGESIFMGAQSATAQERMDQLIAWREQELVSEDEFEEKRKQLVAEL